MIPDLRADNTLYNVGDEVRTYDNDAVVFRARNKAISGVDPYDDLFYYAQIGDVISDGGVIWDVLEAWRIPVTVRIDPIPDRRTSRINIVCQHPQDNPRHFDGGLITFQTGDNATFSREVKYVDFSSDGEAEVGLYLRMPFDINPGDFAYIIPGCDKRIETCAAKFANSINFKGFPHVPGDDYLKQYPDSKY